jgi:hypothetical protein
MTTCRCGSDTHRDFPDKTERCSGCDRTPAWCRCERSASQRQPLWLSLARQRRGGLSRDLTGAA